MTAGRAIRDTVGIGLAWALGWAMAGLLIGAATWVLPPAVGAWFFAEVFDAPLPALALPGFFTALLFVTALHLLRPHANLAAAPAWLATTAGACAGILLVLAPVAAGFATGPLLPLAPTLLIAALGGLSALAMRGMAIRRSRG